MAHAQRRISITAAKTGREHRLARWSCGRRRTSVPAPTRTPPSASSRRRDSGCSGGRARPRRAPRDRRQAPEPCRRPGTQHAPRLVDAARPAVVGPDEDRRRHRQPHVDAIRTRPPGEALCRHPPHHRERHVVRARIERPTMAADRPRSARVQQLGADERDCRRRQAHRLRAAEIRARGPARTPTTSRRSWRADAEPARSHRRARLLPPAPVRDGARRAEQTRRCRVNARDTGQHRLQPPQRDPARLGAAWRVARHRHQPGRRRDSRAAGAARRTAPRTWRRWRRCRWRGRSDRHHRESGVAGAAPRSGIAQVGQRRLSSERQAAFVAVRRRGAGVTPPSAQARLPPCLAPRSNPSPPAVVLELQRGAPRSSSSSSRSARAKRNTVAQRASSRDSRWLAWRYSRPGEPQQPADDAHSRSQLSVSAASCCRPGFRNRAELGFPLFSETPHFADIDRFWTRRMRQR